jgi:thiol:disulfide interchange protein DsbD
LLAIKTVAARFEDVEMRLKSLHPFALPEIITAERIHAPRPTCPGCGRPPMKPMLTEHILRAPARPAARLGAVLLVATALTGPTALQAKLPPGMTSAAATAAPAESGIDAVLGTHRSQSGEGDFLSPDEAFRFDAIPDGPDRVRLVWEITDGYYLYRARVKVSTTSDRAQLGNLAMPAGQIKTDDYFGKQEVYHRELIATVPVARSAGAPLELPLKVTYQGCADAGLCYPPITKTLNVSLPAGSGGGAGAPGGFVSEQDRLGELVRTGNLFLVLGTFFGLGLLLGCTPCVLPMVPILSGIIVGQGNNITARRAFTLSLTYVLGMALTYTVAGALFATFGQGQQAQAVFQQPWIIAVFSAVLIALALSMFGLFTLQMPAAVQTRLAELSSRQSAGTIGGVAVMGALSALIVTTCVAPALVAVLAVIAQTGDAVRGAVTLFAMSFGMGTPLLIVGASAGKLLPKAGPWMDTVKKFFGVLMLAVAAWMLARIVPPRIGLVLWAVPALLGTWVLWPAARNRSLTGWLVRAAGVAAGLFGVALVTGAVLGGTDPLAPIPSLARDHRELPFRTIKSVADLEREVAQAKSHGRAVLLDFYADWCVSCKEMERYTFSDTTVQTALNGTVLLRANVTDNDAEDQALLKHFGIFGPPTIAFYGSDGQERRNYRVVGYMKAPEFATLAREALGSSKKLSEHTTPGTQPLARDPKVTPFGSRSKAPQVTFDNQTRDPKATPFGSRSKAPQATFDNQTRDPNVEPKTS